MMKKVLGRGLSSLIPDSYIKEIESQKTEGSLTNENQSDAPRGQKSFQMIPIVSIKPNPDQPRKEFSPDGIEQLAASIKEKGILQPVVVKKTGEASYELICGERRLKAAILCGLSEVPAIIKDIAEDDFLEWGLIENIQREDLTPIEEAEAYRRLAEERMLSQEMIAKKVGKDRATVANTLRLLRLPLEVRRHLEEGLMSAGHARAILGLLTPEHQRQIAKRIIDENLTVRQVEAMVQRSNAHKRKARRARNLSPEIVDLETRLSEHLGTKVKIFPRKDLTQGRIEMQYFSLDDLDRMLEKIGLPPR